MATKIRLARGGSKKRPFYRIVVADVRSPRDGKFIEKLGTYNPLLAKEDDNRVVIDADRAKHWISQGAKPSDRVQYLLFLKGIMDSKPAEKPARKSNKAPAEEPQVEQPAAEDKATEETAA